MKIEDDVKLDFADVLIRPKRSNLDSRSKVDVRRTFKFKLPAGEFSWSGVPIRLLNNICELHTLHQIQKETLPFEMFQQCPYLLRQWEHQSK